MLITMVVRNLMTHGKICLHAYMCEPTTIISIKTLLSIIECFLYTPE